MDMQKIYIENRQSVFYHVLGMVKDYHDSEEVTNNVFLKMFRLECASYKEKHGTALTSWIRTITNHQILDYFRTNHQDRYKAVSDFIDKEGQELFEFDAPKSDQADELVLSAELQNKIDKVFYELKPEYRRIATLYFIHEYEYHDIADMLDIPIGTVKGMISRSRAKLQNSLKDVYKLKKAIAK